MNWWQLLPWKDIVGLLVVAAIAGTTLYVFIYYPGQRYPPNFGFGPEWSCTRVGQGEPVCVKK
jgi:hypothetical protein